MSSEAVDYAKDFDSFEKEVRGEAQDDDSDDEGGKEWGSYEEEEEENALPGQQKKQSKDPKHPEYMFFDFRRGSSAWPRNIEYIDPQTGEEIVRKATEEAEKLIESKMKMETEGEEKDGTRPAGAASGVSFWNVDAASAQKKEEKVINDCLHPDATFEVLNDGSTAFVVKAGYRLKVNLKELLQGGDEAREKRLLLEAKAKKRALKWAGGVSYGGTNWRSGVWKDPKVYINEYTVTMDVKLTGEPPREGISVFQTALVHTKEHKRTGKVSLNKTDGECTINQAGGVGMFGTFGDTTKAKLEPGMWHRVVIAIKCSGSENEKGKMKTWVGTHPGVVLKEEAFDNNGRFAIDPENFYLFSSGQQSMMPGNISIRTLRVEKSYATDDYVRKNHARDKVTAEPIFQYSIP